MGIETERQGFNPKQPQRCKWIEFSKERPVPFAGPFISLLSAAVLPAEPFIFFLPYFLPFFLPGPMRPFIFLFTGNFLLKNKKIFIYKA